MAKRQTRRSISVKGKTYARMLLAQTIAAEAAERGSPTHPVQSISDFIETVVARELDARGVPMCESGPPRKATPVDPDEIVSQHFTF